MLRLVSFGFQVAMTLFEVFDWLELTLIGTAIRDSVWLFPVIESFHLIGLALLGGSILVTDFRLLGITLNRVSIYTTAKNCHKFFLISIAMMASTGIPLFLSEAIKCYYNPFFWIKMGSLLFALIFTFTIRRKITINENTITSNSTRTAGIVSMLAWFSVATAGRWIGFY